MLLLVVAAVLNVNAGNKNCATAENFYVITRAYAFQVNSDKIRFQSPPPQSTKNFLNHEFYINSRNAKKVFVFRYFFLQINVVGTVSTCEI